MSNESYRAGDWYCPSCNNHNFARRTHCKLCGVAKEAGPSGSYGGGGGGGGGWGGSSGANVSREAGDWDCAHCGNMNFARRRECNRCGGPRTEGDHSHSSGHGGWGGGHGHDYDARAAHAQPGVRARAADDWDCWVCGMMNFARRTACGRCQYEKDQCLPKRGAESAQPGDWLCMQCQSVNGSATHECGYCRADRRTYSNERVMERLA